MTFTIEPKANKTSQQVKFRWSPYIRQGQVSVRHSVKPANDANYDLPETRRNTVNSRQTHQAPQPISTEDALDAWARHAAARSGFGDLP